MYKIVLTLIMMIFSYNTIYANLPEFLTTDEHFEMKNQNYKHENELKHKFEKLQAFSSKIIRRPYDVIKYNLIFDWYDLMKRDSVNDVDRQFLAKNTITVVIDSANLTNIDFDSYDQQILFISINNKNIPSFKQPLGGKLIIPFEKSPNIGDTLIIEIGYKYIGKQNYGFYLYPKKLYVGQGPPPNNDSVFVEERLAYLMSEPEMARYWMPCNDRPYDKSFVEITCRLPKGYNCVANGLLNETKQLGDTTIYRWVDRDIMTTYLIHLAASKFANFRHYYDKVTEKGTKIPIEYFVWRVDSTNEKTDRTVYNAENSFRNVVRMMEVYSSAFIEYPFVKYGMVAVQPFNFGGMEHQTITTINRSWLRGRDDAGIAHELAHQWLGDLITCATWKDLWINEGGATWGEAIWAESFGYKNYLDVMLSKRLYYFWGGGHTLPKIYDMSMNDLFNVYITYYKSSWIYHMLRMQLGDERYFKTLRNLLNKNKFKSLETVDFMNFFINENQDMKDYINDFFEQWLNHQGHPIFSTFSRAREKDNNWEVTVKVSQLQNFSGVPDIFKSNIRLLINDENNSLIKQEIVYMDKKEQEFTILLDKYPNKVIVDTTYILCDFVSSDITKVDDKNINEFSIYPNPIHIGDKILINLSEELKEYSEITIIDILGNEIYKNSSPKLTTLQIPTNNFSSGNYFVIINSNNRKIYSKLLIY